MLQDSSQSIQHVVQSQASSERAEEIRQRRLELRDPHIPRSPFRSKVHRRAEEHQEIAESPLVTAPNEPKSPVESTRNPHKTPVKQTSSADAVFASLNRRGIFKNSGQIVEGSANTYRRLTPLAEGISQTRDSDNLNRKYIMVLNNMNQLQGAVLNSSEYARKAHRDAGQKEIEASQKDIASRHKYKYIELPRISRKAHRKRRIAHELGPENEADRDRAVRAETKICDFPRRCSGEIAYAERRREAV
ncbi:hypothetical protein B0H14DRAFT_2606946 [Mycena olivaceomarginata]|nr:hypothetical protein B0H14DRAFT_2606946 [Mycena olivaceomarginata]